MRIDRTVQSPKSNTIDRRRYGHDGSSSCKLFSWHLRRRRDGLADLLHAPQRRLLHEVLELRPGGLFIVGGLRAVEIHLVRRDRSVRVAIARGAAATAASGACGRGRLRSAP